MEVFGPFGSESCYFESLLLSQGAGREQAAAPEGGDDFSGSHREDQAQHEIRHAEDDELLIRTQGVVQTGTQETTQYELSEEQAC